MIAALLLRLGVAERLRGPLAILIALAAVAALCGLLWLGFHRYVAGEREQAVQIDRADVAAEAANRVLEADRAAAANDTIRADLLANETREIDREAAKGIAEPVGPGVAAVVRRVREQQTARRRDEAAR